MKELKTLKDIQKPIRNTESSCIRVEELKAEAVKWYWDIDNMNALVFIKHFFNLTEEDLKGEGK